MSLELKPLLDYDLVEVAELLNRGFADYLIKIEFNVAVLLHMVLHDGIDAGSSRVVLRDGEAVGVAMIARCGWSSRLAGMAIVPEARGQGAGSWLMAQLVAEAKARGERRMVLEVIEQNTAAVHLYEVCGFQVLRRLVSYAGSADGEGEKAELEQVDTREVAQMVTMYGLPDLPWQISGESLVHVGPPNRAYRMGTAYVVISNPDASRIGLRAVVVEPEARGQGRATRLLRAVMAHHPGKGWAVPALCPEEIGGLFEKVGLVKGPLAQLQMGIEF